MIFSGTTNRFTFNFYGRPGGGADLQGVLVILTLDMLADGPAHRHADHNTSPHAGSEVKIST